MRRDKKAVVFYGPDSAFESLLCGDIKECEQTVDYLESVRTYNARIRASDLSSREIKEAIKAKVDNCIVRTNDYGSVMGHVIANFATVLEEAFEFTTAYVQNCPRRVLSSLVSAYGPDAVDMVYAEHRELGKADLPGIYASLHERIFGQDACKKTLLTALYRLSVMSDDSPSVVLFYGPSGVGKTEMAKAVSESLGGKLTRVQFSMMQTSEAHEYLFGAEHSKASFARDLLCRESNIVLIDEFDKVHPGLYNMFYQLFDEGRYVDTNYDVDMSGSLIVLTSNFSTEEEIKRAVGPAIFSRIDACIGFEELRVEEKRAIARRQFLYIYERLDSDDRAVIDLSDIVEWFDENAGRYDNMRILKIKVEKAIFEKLTQKMLEGEASR